MPAINVPQPEFMEDEEISIFADAVGKFYQQHAPEKRVLKWREDGQVEREFWNEAGQAGLWRWLLCVCEHACGPEGGCETGA